MTAAHRPPHDRIALALLVGGALGACQGVVYQALSEAGVEPVWDKEISIGAINSALIADNRPGTRVQALCRAMHDLLGKRPPELRQLCETELLVGEADEESYNIVQLIYRSRNYEFISKDY